MENYNFTVMHKNEEAAYVQISADHKNVSIKKILPDGIKQPFSGDKLDLERVYSFLKDRCFEDGYAELENVIGKPFAANLEYQAHCFGYGLKIDYEKLQAKLMHEPENRCLDVLRKQLERYEKCFKK